MCSWSRGCLQGCGCLVCFPTSLLMHHVARMALPARARFSPGLRAIDHLSLFAGDGFHKAYVELLRDTGRMSAEDVRNQRTPQRTPNAHVALSPCASSPAPFRAAPQVVAKHLKTSIEDADFWRGSIRIVERKLDAFEAALEKLGL